MRRLLVLLGLVTAFVVPVPVAGAAAPVSSVAETVTPPVFHVSAPAGAKRAALAVTAKIHHYNICNAFDGDPCDQQQAANAENILRFLAVADGAWFISINEICQATFARLAAQLGSDGTMVFSKVREPDCGNQGYGNAILHPGGVRQDGTAWYFPTQTPGRDCTDPTTECRTGLCLKLGTFAGPMAMCTAHLGAGSVADTRTQSAEYAFIARSWVEQGRRLSLAGDFNLEPNQLHPVYEGMVDLVLGPTHHTRTGVDRQIDYIFVEPVGTWTGHTPFCDAQASDHCFTNGDWHL
jgi:endonuclease/exonuclease/phosphatase family metal-dependent hydrolase